MAYETVASLLQAFYRLTGTNDADDALVEQGEAENAVAYHYLTQGAWAAQRWMLKMGYQGWQRRSAALAFSGTDAADGGRSTDLPDDFLRAAGNERRSALREANGDGWGHQVTEDEKHRHGNLFYFKGEQLWLARNAQPPGTLYLEHYYRHPTINAALLDADLDFPLEARPLIVAEAANEAKEDNWLPAGPEMEQKIERALARAREKARDISRPTKQPRHFRKPTQHGSRW